VLLYLLVAKTETNFRVIIFQKFIQKRHFCSRADIEAHFD